MSGSISLSDNIRPILGTIRSVPVPARAGTDTIERAAPFVTISREPGAGGWLLATQFVDSLNHTLDEAHHWTCWDRELVEKVAADHHLSTRLIDSLEDRGHSWLTDFLGSLSFSDDPSRAGETQVYGRVAQTIRALAQAGRVVIVGLGGVFITRGMPGGIHIRLVAPLEFRVQLVAEQQQLSHTQAAARVKELERNRLNFFRHYWPCHSLGAETFALTMNTANIETDVMVEMLNALIRNVEQPNSPVAAH